MNSLKNKILKILILFMRILPPETSSSLSLNSIKFIFSVNKNFFKPNANLKFKKIPLKNLEFRNCLGLAAGVDKKGKYFDALSSIGFSFIEVGTFTPIAQNGNNHPRIKRISNELSLINRLGFNNPGILKGVENIARNKPNFSGILGISIGKNKDTPIDTAFKDYLYCLENCFHVADYIAVNISSPNTTDLRKLSSEDYIEHLTKELTLKANSLQKSHKKDVPIFLKLSPDEEDSNIEKIISTSLINGISGFIVSNTTMGKYKNISGGISGKLLKKKSLNMLKKVTNLLGNESFVISSGGISDKSDLIERLDNGAKLAQIYTSFVYEGPKVVEELLN